MLQAMYKPTTLTHQRNFTLSFGWVIGLNSNSDEGGGLEEWEFHGAPTSGSIISQGPITRIENQLIVQKGAHIRRTDRITRIRPDRPNGPNRPDRNRNRNRTRHRHKHRNRSDRSDRSKHFYVVFETRKPPDLASQQCQVATFCGSPFWAPITCTTSPEECPNPTNHICLDGAKVSQF